MERKQFWPNKRRDEIYATTEISFFLFSVFHFRDFERTWIPWIPWATYIKYVENIEIEDSSRLLYILVGTKSEEGEGNLRSYSRSSSLHERLDSSKRLQGQDPDPDPRLFRT